MNILRSWSCCYTRGQGGRCLGLGGFTVVPLSAFMPVITVEGQLRQPEPESSKEARPRLLRNKGLVIPLSKQLRLVTAS